MEQKNSATLGDVFKHTKNNSIELGNRNFILLGDPSMKISKKQGEIALTHINEASVSESISPLKALQEHTFQGKLTNPSGELQENFDGGMIMELVGNPIRRMSLGDQSAPYAYKKENVLYRGIVAVQQGRFEHTIQLPKDIGNEEQIAFIRFSATDTLNAQYFTGSFTNLRVGGIATENQDDTPPSIHLQLSDGIPYSDGMKITPFSDWILTLSDQSGINLNEIDETHSITLTIDNEQVFFLNDDFITNGDGGKAPFKTHLENGAHVFHIQAYDIHNNKSEKEFTVLVSDLPEMKISRVSVYPNPMQSEANITFEHNREGDDISANLKILTLRGELLFDQDWEFPTSRKEVDEMDIYLNKQVRGTFPSGVYFFQLIVESESDGSKAKYFGRLIVKNGN